MEPESDHANTSPLEAELTRLQQRPHRSPVRSESPDELLSYLRWLRSRLGYIDTLSSDVRRRQVPIEAVYQASPIEWSVSVRVADMKIKKIWRINRRASKAELAGSIEPAGVSAGFEAAVADKVIALAERIQDAIDKGTDSVYDSPAARPLALAPPWYEGRKDDFWPLYAHDAVTLYRSLVVLGPPGSGKTTFCRHLAVSLADQQIAGSGTSEHHGWGLWNLVPIYVELRRMFGAERFSDQRHGLTFEDIMEYLSSQLSKDGLAAAVDAIRDCARTKRAILILDGVDEIPIPSQDSDLQWRVTQLSGLVRKIRIQYPNLHIVLTCRERAYGTWRLEGVHEARLAPLGNRDAARLVKRLMEENGVSTQVAADKSADLMKALGSVPASLRDYPLFLTLMAALANSSSGKLPTKRAALYGRGIDLLLLRWTRGATEESSLVRQLGCSLDDLLARLKVIAFETHGMSLGDKSTPGDIGFDTLVTELFRAGRATNTHSILAYLTEQAGVIVAREHERFQFAHRGFQEYLAAAHLRDLLDQHLSHGERATFEVLGTLLADAPDLWREPALLLGDIVMMGQRPSDIMDLIDALLPDDPETLDSADSRWISVWVAARYVLEYPALTSRTRRHSGTLKLLQHCLVTYLSTTVDTTVSDRVDIARALSRLGDPRPGVGIVRGVPDIAWCRVDGGRYVLGSTAEEIASINMRTWASGWSFDREHPESEVVLESYAISKYTISQSQFRAFLDDPDGYADDRWWTSSGILWRNSVNAYPLAEWGDEPNFPQTNISWYDSLAFCSWLSMHLGYRVALPSEAQWEIAARWRSRRHFPWGDDFVAVMCNYNQSGINRPVPVGCLERSSLDTLSPSDMSGNVWEWCSTIAAEVGGKEYRYPYSAEDGREDVEKGDSYWRSARGGSYLNPPFLLRSAYRGRDLPSARQSRSGFRIVTQDPTVLNSSSMG